MPVCSSFCFITDKRPFHPDNIPIWPNTQSFSSRQNDMPKNPHPIPACYSVRKNISDNLKKQVFVWNNKNNIYICPEEKQIDYNHETCNGKYILLVAPLTTP